jgi:formamidopyrimidine-DNA glycosylase
MPELPEVESVLQCLTTSNPSLIGRLVRGVRILRDSVVEGDVDTVVQTVTGLTCCAVCRHGKYLFFGFQGHSASKPVWLALHLRMTGRLFLVPEQEIAERYTRFALLFDQGLALRFDDPRAFGRVWLVDDPSEVTSKLGPDALLIQQKRFLDRLYSVRRQLKPLLLDQAFVAGVGNIYADETLFRAQLHPARPSADLTSPEAERLYHALHGVLTQAVAAKGANIDGVFEAGAFPVAVYGRGGKPCPVCDTFIVKQRLGQRGTHFCPVCQPFR